MFDIPPTAGCVSPAISVIVVVHNARETAGRCLESILAQSFKDIELIIVDDGSTDGTVDVLLRYASRHGNISVLPQECAGVAAARQKGLDMASGLFTIFVDADDWIEPDMLDRMYRQAVASGADMVITDMLEERRSGTQRIRQDPGSLCPGKVMARMLTELHGSLCNKLIRRSCYTAYGIRFLPGLNCCEDQYVVMKLLSHGIKVTYLDAAFYHYVKSGDGSSLTGKWMRFPLSQRVRLIEEFKNLSGDSYYRTCFNRYVALVAYDAIFAPKSERKHFRELFHPYKSDIRKATLPFHKKFLIEFYLHGIQLPVQGIKQYIRTVH